MPTRSLAVLGRSEYKIGTTVVAPPTMTGELVKLDKGPAIESLQKKHHLRPFMLDVYKVEFNFG